MKVRGIDFVGVSFEPGTPIRDIVTFYRETLGIDAPYTEGDGETDKWTEIDTYPIALSFIKWPGAGKAAIALAVDDVYAAVEELKAKGVTIVYEPYESQPCVMAAIEDPWGNRLILHARKDGTVG